MVEYAGRGGRSTVSSILFLSEMCIRDSPGTKQPLKAEDLYPIFAEELCRQELNQTDTWIEIPEELSLIHIYNRTSYTLDRVSSRLQMTMWSQIAP